MKFKVVIGSLALFLISAIEVAYADAAYVTLQNDFHGDFTCTPQSPFPPNITPQTCNPLSAGNNQLVLTATPSVDNQKATAVFIYTTYYAPYNQYIPFEVDVTFNGDGTFNSAYCFDGQPPVLCAAHKGDQPNAVIMKITNLDEP